MPPFWMPTSMAIVREERSSTRESLQSRYPSTSPTTLWSTEAMNSSTPSSMSCARPFAIVISVTNRMPNIAAAGIHRSISGQSRQSAW